MRHAILVVLLGVASGVGAHVAWFGLNRPCKGVGLDCQLGWMKSELKLSDAQMERIKSLHEASSPRLLALAGQVARMREEYAAFERERATSGEVDFLEFARFVEKRRAVDAECLASTRRLVSATTEVMTPAQRAHYLNLVEPSFRMHDLSSAN